MIEDKMQALAQLIRERIDYHRDDYYCDTLDSKVNTAVRTALKEVAAAIMQIFTQE